MPTRTLLSKVAVAVCMAATISIGSGGVAAAVDGVEQREPLTYWSECIYPDQVSVPENALIDRFTVRGTANEAVLFCGSDSGSSAFYGGVRHIKAGHGYDSNTEACIERVLQNHQRIVQGTDPSGNALEYVYAVPNFKEVSVVIMLNDNSVRTVFAPGEPNNQLDYARCAAST